jgi:uncharacterized YccA/Bax inhibitor family protein
MWSSSNPVLANDDAFEKYYGSTMAAAKPGVATLSGVINKTAILVLIAVTAGAAGYMLLPTTPSILWISAIAAFVLCLGFGFLLAGKPQLSPVIAPIYAVVEGVFLGSLTAALESVLASMQKAPPGGLALQAFIITIAVTVGMLALYAARIIKPTKTFQAVVGTLVVGIMFSYMLMFVLHLFGTTLPFLSLGSALQGGTSAWIGLGLNGFILVVAALTLVLDFKLVEDRVAAGSPKYIEWYCGFALLVTIAWIYYEAVKMAFRVAALMRR